MKLSRSRICSLVAAASVFLIVLALAVPAFAALEDPPSGTSTTNPNAGDAEWRAGWGNSLWPNIHVDVIPTDALGFM